MINPLLNRARPARYCVLLYFFPLDASIEACTPMRPKKTVKIPIAEDRKTAFSTLHPSSVDFSPSITVPSPSASVMTRSPASPGLTYLSTV